MASPVTPLVLPEDAVVITLLGRKYVFANCEEAREWMQQPMSDWEAQQWKDVLAGIEEHRQEYLEEHDGKGISLEDIEEALREARDH
jgi:hypothetical protein